MSKLLQLSRDSSWQSALQRFIAECPDVDNFDGDSYPQNISYSVTYLNADGLRQSVSNETEWRQAVKLSLSNNRKFMYAFVTRHSIQQSKAIKTVRYSSWSINNARKASNQSFLPPVSTARQASAVSKASSNFSLEKPKAAAYRIDTNLPRTHWINGSQYQDVSITQLRPARTVTLPPIVKPMSKPANTSAPKFPQLPQEPIGMPWWFNAHPQQFMMPFGHPSPQHQQLSPTSQMFLPPIMPYPQLMKSNQSENIQNHSLKYSWTPEPAQMPGRPFQPGMRTGYAGRTRNK